MNTNKIVYVVTDVDTCSPPNAGLIIGIFDNRQLAEQCLANLPTNPRYSYFSGQFADFCVEEYELNPN